MSTGKTKMDWVFPVKRNEGDTVDDRLTDTVRNETLPNRYLNKNADGEVIETPAEMFERVAKNIALAEAVYESEKLGHEIEVTPDQIKPSHPRRGVLAAEVFGFDGRIHKRLRDVPNDLEEAKSHLLDESVVLDERNISKFAYDTIVPEIDNENVVSHVKEIKDKFEHMMKHLDWMPNSPTLMNAGSELQQCSACFVMSPEDDIDHIFETQKKAASVFQSGGGCGYAFSDLRPYGDRVGSTGGIASGPITFMEAYDAMCETIAQGGTRRGAQMGVMRVTHPDVIQFIHSKNKDVSLAHSLRLNDPDDFTHDTFLEALEEARELIDEDGNIPRHLRNAAEGHLSNFNISVTVTDEFMEAVMAEEDYQLINPRTGEPHIATEKTKELYERFDMGKYVEVGEELTLPAHKVMERIVEGAHENGEPGLLMIDRANEKHSFPVESSAGQPHSEHEILSSNPCGEQFLEEYEACNLGHINLSTLAKKEPGYSNSIHTMEEIESHPVERDFREWHEKETEAGYTGSKDDADHISKFLDQAIDWEEFDRRIDLGTRFLENVCTMSDFPVEQIEETVRKNRKTGLGIMGLAQLFVQLGIKYGSDVSSEVTKQLMVYINRNAKQKSHELAVQQERGSFATHSESKFTDPIEYREWFEHETGESADDWEDGYPIRNHNVTTIAPTGTTSQISRTSGGCEPIFSVINLRTSSGDIHDGGLYIEADDYFMRVLEANGIDKEDVKEEARELMENNEYEGIKSLSTVPNSLLESELFVTTRELEPKQHADIQCAAQKGVDSSISKTINAPADQTVEDALDVFLYIYKNGGKGVTYYRDGSRSKQIKTTRTQNTEFSDDMEAAGEILNHIEEIFGSIEGFLETEEVKEKISESVLESVEETYGLNEKRPRPDVLYGVTQRIDTGYGKVYVNINEDENGNPFELFTTIGNSGGFTASFASALAKTISTALRSGVDPQEIADELTGIRSPKVAYDKQEQINSVPDAIGTALQRYLNEDIEDYEPIQQKLTEATEATEPDQTNKEQSHKNTEANQEDDIDIEKQLISNGDSPECPECGEMSLYYSEGCKTCESCGWSEC